MPRKQAQKPTLQLQICPVRYDWDILERALRPGPTWTFKAAEMTSLLEITLHNISDPEKADELEALKYFLGQVEAAKMICLANAELDALERHECISPIVKSLTVDKAAQRPICFCDHFWVVRSASGGRYAFARGMMREVESSLSSGAQGKAPEYKIAEVFSLLMSYSHIAGQAPKIQSIVDEGLSRLIHENLVPQFLSLPLLPSRERDDALKSLRSMLISAFDAASRGNDFKLHRSREMVAWNEPDGESKKVLPAWAAIQHVKSWLAQNLALPTKGELQERMLEAHPELSALKKSSWSGIWAESSLKGLPRSKPIIAKAKGQLDRVRAKFTKTARKS